MGKATDGIRIRLKDYFLIVLGLVSSLVILVVPLQLYVPLGRYQHYGLAVFVLGLGYVIQVVWSWPRLKRWPRRGYAITGLYLTSVGIVLYANPWLDSRVAIMTEEKESLKALIGWLYTMLGLPLAYVYIEWMKEEKKVFKDKGGKR